MTRREHFNSIAPAWDSMPALPGADEKVRRFVREALHPADRVILDVGCGTGILVPALLQHGAARIIECDFAEGMLVENRRKWPDRRIGRVCADALALPLAGESFDAVLCFGILPHLGHLAEPVADMLRCLRPGGVFAAGHLLGSDALNEFHSTLDGPVREDRLIRSEDLALLLRLLGMLPSSIGERDDWYFVAAEKPAGEAPPLWAGMDRTY